MNYSFQYSSTPKVSKYSICFKKLNRTYPFAYFSGNKGIYSFEYDPREEMYYENPLKEFMYPQHQLVTEKLIKEFMYPEKHMFCNTESLHERYRYKEIYKLKEQILNNIKLGSIIKDKFLSAKFKNMCLSAEFSLDKSLNEIFAIIDFLAEIPFKSLDKNIQYILQNHTKESIFEKVQELESTDKIFILLNNNIYSRYLQNIYLNSGFLELVKEAELEKYVDLFLNSSLNQSYILSTKLYGKQLKSVDVIFDPLLNLVNPDVLQNNGYLLKKPEKEVFKQSLYWFQKGFKNLEILKFFDFEILPKTINKEHIKLLNRNDLTVFNNVAYFYEMYKESAIDRLITFYGEADKEIANYNIAQSLVKNFKEAINDFVDIKYKKEFNQIFNSEVDKEIDYKLPLYFGFLNNVYLQQKVSKDIKLPQIYTSLEKDIKLSDIEMVLKALDRNKEKNLKQELIYINLSRDILKDLLREKQEKQLDLIVFKKMFVDKLETELKKYALKNILKSEMNKSLNRKNDKNIYLTEESYLDKYIKEIISSEVVICADKIYKEIAAEKHKMLETVWKNVFVENVVFIGKETLQAITEKENLLNQENKVAEILESLLLNNEKIIGNINSERELKLWSRFWFLCSGSEKDNKILPCCDYPYEQQPIEFEGFEDLIPTNYHSVYPNNFNRIIDKHPILEGMELGLKEIPLSINIMVEIINIFIMLWIKYYRAFWGWTGTQAVLGITNSIFEWLTLESSRVEQENKGSKEHYDRCYRWLRWESEKMALMARNDMELRGNYYVGLYLEELINYIQDHHFDTMPIFKDVGKMDEWRGVFGKDLEKDITWILDKVKGIRHKVIVGKEKKYNG